MISEEVSKAFTRMGDLIDEGKLPLEVIPRMFYCGHKLLHTVHQEMRKLKCVACAHEWEAKENFKAKIYPVSICPNCNANNDEIDNVYDITGDDQVAWWQCVKCEHKFCSQDGTVCPECGEVKK